MPLRHENLRAHQIYSRNHFRHGVFDLDPRIYLNEVPLLRVDVVKELNRPRVPIFCFAHQFYGCIT